VATDEFLRARTLDCELRDGTPVRVRPIAPDDKDRLAEGMKRLSPQSRYRRFFSNMETLDPALLRHLTEVDYSDHFAWLAVSRDEPGGPAVGVGRYIRLRDRPTAAEVAITVRDDYQGRGLGTLLLDLLGLVALEHGIDEFVAIVQPENSPMRALLHSVGIDLAWDPEMGALRGIGPVRGVDAVTNVALAERLQSAARGQQAE
jgi:RimJ/RimL family protein N-acetyltransferase